MFDRWREENFGSQIPSAKILSGRPAGEESGREVGLSSWNARNIPRKTLSPRQEQIEPVTLRAKGVQEHVKSWIVERRTFLTEPQVSDGFPFGTSPYH